MTFIVANILCEPLKQLASSFTQALSTGGYVILSGILNEQALQVVEVYKKLGLHFKEHKKQGEWSTLLLCKG